jgi:preprotein translocase subunit SecY
MGFTYFYVSLVFDPKKMAENIQKRNGYIPGYRPGTETIDLLGSITLRLSFWGGLFLALVAIAPTFFEKFVGQGNSSITLFISGAGIIIVVSVVMDLVRRINAHLVMQNYDKL